MLSSPNGNMLWTGDPEVINQIAGQGTNFVKPVELFSFFDIYGPNMQTSKGDDWRSHRKIVAPAIGPHSNAAIWQAALEESKKLLIDLLKKEQPVIAHMKDHMSEISLHCITQTLFDKKLEYETTQTLYPKHYEVALIPFEVIKRADKAYWDLHSYIVDICDKATDMDKQAPNTTDMTIMDALIAGTRPESAEKHGKVLSRDNLIGNVFFFLLSGHGTAGNTLGFLMFLLAVRQDIQSLLQAHLDTQLGDKPVNTWTVNDDFMRLYTGYTGSVLKEAMRLYNVVEFIPRRCTIDTPITDLSGAQFVVPKNTLCLLNFTAAFRHPKIWPAKPDCIDGTGRYHPILDFDPIRWDSYGDKITKPSDVGLRTYFPFGLGGRACLGKSLGSIMMVGVLAAIFKDYSIELVAPRVIREEASKNGAGEEWIKGRTYDWALRMLMDEVECNLLIELRKELPLRLVSRKQL
ncbi:MAG: hypothetical protein Q9179_002190 [Wetmoreana sp. 5 TL-2023]